MAKKGKEFKTPKQNVIKNTRGRVVFLVINTIFMILISLICLLPFVNLLAISFSSKKAVTSGLVTFFPVEFTTVAYKFIISTGSSFYTSLGRSLLRVGLGVPINLILIVLTAYPLSKSPKQFKGRTVYAWYFIITILFNGGLIPSYMIIRNLGLIGNIFALILPGALNVFNMLIVMNYMRSLPPELEEAAMIDGAGYVQSLFRIILPLSKPTLATVTLFSFVNHWNSWFDGLIYSKTASQYPLASYLQTILIDPEQFFRNMTDTTSELSTMVSMVNSRTTNAAQLFLATIPILLIYPLLQRYFTTGLVMGSVKG